MKFKAEDLLKAVATVAGVVPAKGTKEALKNCRISWPAGQDALIHGTDLEVHVEAGVLSDPGPGGVTVCVPCHGLLSVLRVLPPGADVTLDLEDGKCLVKSNGMEYELPVGDPAEMPDFPSEDGAFSIALEAEQVSAAFAAVSYACAREAGRYSMSGVHLELEGKVLTLVATDGRRLAVSKLGDLEISGDSKKAKGITVPHRAVAMVERATTGMVVLSWTSRQFFFTRLNTEGGVLERVVSLLVDGQFPAWQAVMPKESDSKAYVEVDVAEFTQAVKSAAIMADHETRRLSVAFGAATRLEAQGQGLGRSKVQTSAARLKSGKAEPMFLNPGYLADALKPVAGQALVGYYSPNHPLVISSETYKAMIMPLT
jgi:DNA polymerase III subunit beta